MVKKWLLGLPPSCLYSRWEEGERPRAVGMLGVDLAFSPGSPLVLSYCGSFGLQGCWEKSFGLAAPYSQSSILRMEAR